MIGTCVCDADPHGRKPDERSPWLLFCLVHNIETLTDAGYAAYIMREEARAVANDARREAVMTMAGPAPPARGCHVHPQRAVLRNVTTSLARRSGSSSVARCPPRGMSVQCVTSYARSTHDRSAVDA